MKSHHRRADFFFMIIIIFGKKGIMGSPACGRDVFAEQGSVGLLEPHDG